LIVTLYACVCDCCGELESATVREKLEVAVAVGVPEIFQLVPEPPIVNQVGKDEPEATVQV
jgi:hypothetical protein